jgi:hypothetical protein
MDNEPRIVEKPRRVLIFLLQLFLGMAGFFIVPIIAAKICEIIDERYLLEAAISAEAMFFVTTLILGTEQRFKGLFIGFLMGIAVAIGLVLLTIGLCFSGANHW